MNVDVKLNSSNLKKCRISIKPEMICNMLRECASTHGKHGTLGNISYDFMELETDWMDCSRCWTMYEHIHMWSRDLELYNMRSLWLQMRTYYTIGDDKLRCVQYATQSDALILFQRTDMDILHYWIISQNIFTFLQPIHHTNKSMKP